MRLENGDSAAAHNSKLVESLGQVQDVLSDKRTPNPTTNWQVQYVLSDKTGTLTQNKMELLKAWDNPLNPSTLVS